MCTALWQRKWAQRCDSENEHSAVTEMVRIVMLQRWQWPALGHQWLWHRCDSDVYISVTAMATDTAAVTAVTTDSAVPAAAADTTVWAMFTLVWQRWQLTVLWQWAMKTDSAVTAVAADSAVTAMLYISVTALSVATTFTVMCTSLSH